MSIKIINLHEHEIFYSVLIGPVNNQNYKYAMKGMFCLKKFEAIELKENYYIRLRCYACDYKYTSDKKIKALTTDAPHYLFFKENCKEDPYSKENKKIEVDKKYYLSDYFLVNNDYKDNMLVGNEKEIRDYLFSEMEKYKIAYEREKENNKSIINVNEQKEKKIIELNRIIKNLKEELNELKKEFDELKEKFQIKICEPYSFTNEYDVVLNVDSIKNLAINGWEIKFKKEGGKENYEKYFKNVETIVVGVVGNGNKGK